MHGVAQGWLGHLDAEVAQEVCVGLDAVPLVVVIGEVDQLQGQVRPHALQGRPVQDAQVQQLVLKAQDMRRIDILQEGRGESGGGDKIKIMAQSDTISHFSLVLAQGEEVWYVSLDCLHPGRIIFSANIPVFVIVLQILCQLLPGPCFPKTALIIHQFYRISGEGGGRGDKCQF